MSERYHTRLERVITDKGWWPHDLSARSGVPEDVIECAMLNPSSPAMQPTRIHQHAIARALGLAVGHIWPEWEDSPQPVQPTERGGPAVKRAGFQITLEAACKCGAPLSFYGSGVGSVGSVLGIPCLACGKTYTFKWQKIEEEVAKEVPE